MEIVNLDKEFLEKVKAIFDHSKVFGDVVYDELGYLFSDYFMDSLVNEYKKDKEGFTSITSVKSAKS